MYVEKKERPGRECLVRNIWVQKFCLCANEATETVLLSDPPYFAWRKDNQLKKIRKKKRCLDKKRVTDEAFFENRGRILVLCLY